MKHRRSNSTGMCTLPTIPEYPGFQDFKVSRKYLETPAFNRLFPDWERGKSSSSQLNCFPRRPSLVPCLGSSSRRGSLKGHPTSSSGFHDKPLEEYFKERLMELRNYNGKRSNTKAKVSADQNQDPLLSHRGSGHRSSCSAGTGHSKESRETCGSVHPENKEMMDSNHQEETQNVPDLYTGDFLDFLTMYITAPLEAFVQKK